jgi:hypothetical protein
MNKRSAKRILYEAIRYIIPSFRDALDTLLLSSYSNFARINSRGIEGRSLIELLRGKL